jgi:thioredoxin reductase
MDVYIPCTNAMETSLEKHTSKLEMYYEHVIIGGGPASLQLAYFFERHQMNYIVLEKTSECAAFFRMFPRHRQLISVNKVNCGPNDPKKNPENILRYDWNSLLLLPMDYGKILFRDYSEEYYPHVDCLVKYLTDFVDMFDINIRYNCPIVNVQRIDGIYNIHVEGSDEAFTSKYLYCGAGLKPKRLPCTPKVPPTKLFYYYDTMPLDPNIYMNKKVTIVGGGNAAFETANFVNKYADTLTICGAERFAWRTHYPGDIRSINMTILDAYYLKLKTNIDWVDNDFARHDSKYKHYIQRINNGSIWSSCDIVIYCGGFEPRLDYLDAHTIHITKSNKHMFPLTTPFYEAISCPNLYFIGALSQGNDYKHGTSAFIHGFRYNARLVFQHVTHTYDSKQLQHYASVACEIMHQINKSSTLLHRFDIFCDVVVVTASAWHYIKHIPRTASVHDMMKIIGQNETILGIIKVYLGYDHDNPFQLTFRQPQTGSDINKNKESVFIHPILELCNVLSGDTFLTLHLNENAFNIFVSYNTHYCLIVEMLALINKYQQELRPVNEMHMQQWYHTIYFRHLDPHQKAYINMSEFEEH